MCLERCSLTISFKQFCFLCYQYQAFWDASPFCSTRYFWLCAHSHIRGPVWFTSDIDLNSVSKATIYTSSKFLCWLLQVQMIRGLVQSGREGSCKQTNHNELIRNFGENVWIVNPYHPRTWHCRVVVLSTIWRPRTAFSATLKQWQKVGPDLVNWYKAVRSISGSPTFIWQSFNIFKEFLEKLLFEGNRI